MYTQIEAISVQRRCFDIRQRDRRVEIGAGANTLPVLHRAAGRIKALVPVEPGPNVGNPVAIAGKDDDRLLSAREIPEPGQRLAVKIHGKDQVGQQPLLLVSLGDGDLAHVQPVRLRISCGIAVVQVVRTHGSHAVPFLAGPGGVSLASVYDGARQIVCERRRLSTVGANITQGDRRRGEWRSGA